MESKLLLDLLIFLTALGMVAIVACIVMELPKWVGIPIVVSGIAPLLVAYIGLSQYPPFVMLMLLTSGVMIWFGGMKSLNESREFV